MKKLCTIFSVLAILAFMCMPVFAGITGTAHEDSGVSGGPCAACHLPHGAVSGGNRLWPSTPITGTQTNIIGDVSELCAYCHNDQGGARLTYPDADSTDFAYGNNSHGVLMSTSTMPNTYVDSGLEYQDDGTDGAIECTTCHNVHNDPTSGDSSAFRPFLRAGINELCSGCHGNRRFVNGSQLSGTTGLSTTVAAWGGAAYFGTRNPGSHPVGTDITNGDNFGGASPIDIPFEMRVPYDAVAAGWDLGGHLTDGAATGGVICVTCHAVHGVQNDVGGTDNSASMADTVPQPNFLAFYQGTFGDSTGRSIANGDGDFNALCEACHVGTDPNSTDYPSVDLTTFNQNPGGTAWGHPIDDMNARATWTTGFPAGWPTGGGFTAGTNVDPIPICESCHVVHPNANDSANRDDETAAGDFGASEYMLRNTAQAVCTGCHGGGTGGNNEHHPVNVSYDSSGVSGQLPVSGGTELLACGTCHGGGAGGAHNWTSMGYLSMASGWLPADNARGSYVDANMSITCINCHYSMDGDPDVKSPTLHDGLLYNATNEANYETIGTGTHYIGVISADWASYGAVSGRDPYTDAWDASVGGVGGRSRFGGTSLAPDSSVLVCESCHELEPSLNVANDHLLLATYVEEQDNQADERSDFCEGCHLPSGTHPQTNDTVTRTGTTLDTNIAGKAWLEIPTDSNVIMVQGQNIINCDNCHQVHDANTNSYTFILDTAEANVAAPASTDSSAYTYGNYTETEVTPVAAGKGGDHSSFCDQCHPYD